MTDSDDPGYKLDIIKFIHPPQPVGYWDFGGCYISIFIKPTEQQIKNTEEAFGWKWKDEIK